MYLKKDIIFTKGSTNSTLVDRKSGNVYHLNTEATEFIDKHIKTGFEEKNKEDEQEFIEFLRKENLLCVDCKESSLHETLKINRSNSLCRKSFAWIEVTTRCNLRCLHCYNESSIHSTKALTLEQYYDIIDNLQNYGISRVQIIGGEPLVLGEDILKRMIQYTYGKFESIELFTNGTLLNEAMIQWLKDYNVKLAISIYSYSHDIHDNVTTVVGSYEKTMKNVKLLKKYCVTYRVANVLMKGVEIKEANTDLYKPNSRKDILRLSGRGNLHLMTRELLIKKLITEERFSHSLPQYVIEGIMQGHNCFSTKIYIGVDGMVYPCVMERRFNYGSIFEKSLNEILNQSSFISKDDVNECKNCEYRYICFDCRPDSISNNIYEKPWYCTYKPQEGRWEDKEQFVERLCEKYSIT